MIDVSHICSPTEHEAAKADPVRWAAMRLNGTMPTNNDEPGAATLLELRTCGCGSTIAKEVMA